MNELIHSLIIYNKKLVSSSRFLFLRRIFRKRICFNNNLCTRQILRHRSNFRSRYGVARFRERTERFDVVRIYLSES